MRDRLSTDRFHCVSYESLTGDPEATLQGLCEFLQVEYTPSMLNFHSSNEASNAAASSALWGNVTKPVMKDNTKKFLKYASDEEITIFELVAGDVLDALGYERVKIAKGQEIQFTNSAIDKFNEINQGLKAEVLKQVDPEDLKRRDIQASLLQEIKSRQLVAV